MFNKAIQKNMLVLGGLLLLVNFTTPAALAATWLTMPTTTYITAATSADPIIFNHEAIPTNIAITVDDQSDHTAVAKVKDNFAPLVVDIKTYVRNEARKAGLSIAEVETIINCESRWIADAKGHNRNGSYDLGLWQINSIHKNISDADKLDYKAATKWAIEKRLRDGSWSAWSCSRKLASK